MLALATNIKIRAKIHEKLHVFWDLDFDRILGGFWEGFGRPTSSIFALFSMFFRCHFSSALRKAKKLGKNAKKQSFPLFGFGSAVYLDLPGRDLERGIKTSWA